MTEIKWYKRDPKAALEGMAELTLEECGAYNIVLDLIYRNGGKLLDDDRFICGWMRCDMRIWRRIKNRLLERQKVYIEDGFLRNKKADEVVAKALAKGLTNRELNIIKGRKSGEVRRKNKELNEPEHEPNANRKRTDIKKKEDRKEEESKDDRNDAVSAAPEFFRYEGKIIRLTEKDFDAWKSEFGLDDRPLADLLDERDDFLQRLEPADRRRARWWIPTRQWLAGEVENLKKSNRGNSA